MSIRCRPLSRAFSLVEVLIAVLVLALGLLGLGAVFPVVVRQQRIATQTTLGLSAREATKQILVNNENFRPGGRGWAALREYVRDNGGRTGFWVSVAVEPNTGNYIMDPAPGDSGGPVVLPLSQRLHPLPFSSDSAPRFVWDIAARVTEPLNADSPMIVSIFLRPIDPGIRPGRYENDDGQIVPYSLVRTLAGSPPDISLANKRFPISVDDEGRPTFDGRNAGSGGNYAVPIAAEATSPGVDKTPDEIYVTRMLRKGTDLDVAISVLAQPGQKFLDRNGYVYTVTGSTNLGDGKLILFTPTLVDADGDGRIEQAELSPILFVPQAPAVDPIVFTVTP
jgi:type II secretory pathway pseudopilin PulG